MFTAVSPEGKLIHVTSLCQDKVQLQKLKKQSGFLCPYCGKQMHIKGGTEKMKLHFSHKINLSCTSFTGESKEHLEAKELLHFWLHDRGYRPRMEYLLPQAEHQRADIFFILNGRKTAIEIQRSQIEEAEFLKRNAAYEKAGITVIWIGLTSYQSEALSKNLSILDTLRFRNIPFQHSFSLDLNTGEVLMEYGFTQLQQSKSIHAVLSLSLSASPEKIFFPAKQPRLPSKYFQLLDSEWKRTGRKKRVQPKIKLTPSEKEVIAYYWNYQLNLNYYPALCHLPVISAAGLKIGAELWQSWILFRFMQQSGSYVSISEICKSLLNWKYFSWYPQSEHIGNVMRKAVAEYCGMLAYAGALKRIYPGVYQVLQPLTIKKSLDTLLQDDLYIRKFMKNYFEFKNN